MRKWPFQLPPLPGGYRIALAPYHWLRKRKVHEEGAHAAPAMAETKKGWIAVIDDAQPSAAAAEPVAITGQILRVKEGIEALLNQRAPIDKLKPGQLFRRVSDQLRASGFNARELPSRSSFERFRRGFGRRYNLR